MYSGTPAFPNFLAPKLHNPIFYMTDHPSELRPCLRKPIQAIFDAAGYLAHEKNSS